MKIFTIVLWITGMFILIWLNKIRIYLKQEKKKKKNDKPFYRWTLNVHSEPVQVARLEEARKGNFTINYVNEEKGICQIKEKSDPEVYFSSLGLCQCKDFKENRKPCKHIYKIAIEKGLI
ncbi:SWIM zinc finger family protein [Lacrimispora indolis]|uniref:SWIM zinc finger family protein n=1 Tax=Lacrimispora indolis TaxID=69825 RepID=UPI00040A2617|nr:SWIM zinc finger family protein [[Clostridium] methoxybenzovorans]